MTINEVQAGRTEWGILIALREKGRERVRERERERGGRGREREEEKRERRDRERVIESAEKYYYCHRQMLRTYPGGLH